MEEKRQKMTENGGEEESIREKESREAEHVAEGSPSTKKSRLYPLHFAGVGAIEATLTRRPDSTTCLNRSQRNTWAMEGTRTTTLLKSQSGSSTPWTKRQRTKKLKGC